MRKFREKKEELENDQRIKREVLENELRIKRGKLEEELQEEREKLEDKQKEIKNNQENVERKHREDFIKEYEEMYMNMSLEYCLLKREEGEFL